MMGFYSNYESVLEAEPVRHDVSPAAETDREAPPVAPSMRGARPLDRRFRFASPPLPQTFRRLGQAAPVDPNTDPNVILAQFYFGLIVPILSAKCAGDAPAAKCAEFQFRLGQIQSAVSTGIAQLTTGSPLALITLGKAVWDAKELYEDVQNELEPEAPPPPPLPAPLPPKPETGFPWWGWALGGLAVLGTGVGIYAATRRR